MKKTLTKGALKVVEADFSLEDELAKARSIASKITDAHGGRGPFKKFTEDDAELLCADVLQYTPDVISNDLAALPAKYRSHIEGLICSAINLGRALNAMEVNSEHGPKIETNKNLRVSTSPITDDQIREALEKHRTREEQAKRLGISVRELQRRLRKMRG